jgi:hypothetical protein
LDDKAGEQPVEPHQEAIFSEVIFLFERIAKHFNALTMTFST